MIIEQMPYRHPVILFYQYTRLAEPRVVVLEQRALCERLGLKGRILIAEEGINGTLAGWPAVVEEYVAAMRRNPAFAEMEYKWSEGAPDTFPKLVVKARREIVSLNLAEDVDVSTNRGTHLSPVEWKARLEGGGGEVVVLDVRNRYESEAGHFAGAIRPAIENFRELPGQLDQWEHLKEKTVLMYCTGGIRCEKAAALLAREGFRDVYQLHGGILAYHEQVGREHWVGDCFVFDQRMVIPGEGTPTGKCAYTSRATNRFVNCLHDPCHRLYLLAPEAEQEEPERQVCPECARGGVRLANADCEMNRALKGVFV